MASSTDETSQGSTNTADSASAKGQTPFTDALVASWTSIVPFLSKSTADSLTSKMDMIQSIAQGVLRIPNRGTGAGPPPLRFTHGCWSAGLVTQLAWHSNNRFPVLHDPPAARQQGQERAPTWSWLSIPGAVNYEFPITTVPGVFCTYLQPGNMFQKPLATARLADGAPLEDAVEVQGDLLPIDSIDLQSDVTMDTGSRHGQRGGVVVIWDTCEEQERVRRLDSLVIEDTYRFWPIYAQTFLHTDSLESRGILLRRIDVPGYQDGAFVRCGWVSYRFENVSAGGSHGNLPSLKKIEAGQDMMTQEFRVL